MSTLAEQLAQKKTGLKHTQVVHDASQPTAQTFAESEEALAAYQQTVLDLNIEEWFPHIQDLTFPTVFLPITLEDAAAFRDAYEQRNMLTAGSEVSLCSDLKQRLQDLEDRLQRGIDEMGGGDPSACVFVKTSSRSAKDSPTTIENLKLLYKKAVEASFEKDENAKLICLLTAQRQAFKMHTAKDVIASFIASERIYQDMLLALRHQDRFRENFVIRKWYEIDSDMEFRGFCYKGKLTALSQYHHFTFFPRLIERKQQIQERIHDYFERQVAHRLTNRMESYIIDFALCGEDLEQIWIIELNPFLETTDGCMFSWQKERAVLENGPFEFRVNERPVRGSRSMIGKFWQCVLDSV